MSSDETTQAGPDGTRGTGYASDRAHALRTLFPAAASKPVLRPASELSQPPADRPTVRGGPPYPTIGPDDQQRSLPDPRAPGPGRHRGVRMVSCGVLIGVVASALAFWLSPNDPSGQAPPESSVTSANEDGAGSGALPTAAGSVTPSTPAALSPDATISARPDQPATPTPALSPSAPVRSQPTTTVNVGRPNPDGRNLALRRSTVASSAEGPHFAPAGAVDGDLDTRWSSDFSDPQWMLVDLGEVWRISSVTLFWERAHATAYRVETSADGRRWSTRYTTTAGTGGTVRLALPGTDARYLRMYGTKRHNQYGYSLLEIEVR
ncbi:F5/8 type C domain-containing protein [Micromonospora sp. Llam0]|uniref:discoidin domain-containing protein n=1 Tax=Micromonospora sp. Llam0 TaxID=2485143 RepID=UPI000F48E63C|nr:discoidin domain-containing protein [Micromonospora sp. Llam0]ROO61633.1 F5/8 type C domain-containing protein [Micromonospora sp. Llam0]